jgi:hypothetical protein
MVAKKYFLATLKADFNGTMSRSHHIFRDFFGEENIKDEEEKANFEQVGLSS